MAELQLSEEADSDLDAIWHYSFAEFGWEVAETYLRSFNDTFASLILHPELGQPIDGFSRPVRSLGHRKHRIFYVINHGAVHVVRILHHAQDANQQLN